MEKKIKTANQMIHEAPSELEHYILKGRFEIIRQIDNGSFGKIYKVTDLKYPKVPLVMKVADDYKSFGGEIHVQHKVSASNKERPQRFLSTPEVIDYGLLTNKHSEEDALSAYVIMPRYG